MPGDYSDDGKTIDFSTMKVKYLTGNQSSFTTCSQGYGPLNMKYDINGLSNTNLNLITNNTNTIVSGSGDNFVGYRGMRITTGYKGLVVTGIGRLNVSGNQNFHQLIIVKANPTIGDLINEAYRNEIVAQTIIKGQTSTSGYSYAFLDQPVLLEPNTMYYVASFEDWSVAGSKDTYLISGNITYNSDNKVKTTFGYTDTPETPNPANGFKVDKELWKMKMNTGDQHYGEWISGSGSGYGIVNLLVK